MFMVSFRLRKGRVLLSVLALVLVAALGVVGVRALRGDTVSAGSGSVEEVKSAKKAVVKTPEQRLEFVRSFGWEVEEEPVEVLEVVIPKEFDKVYEAYNSMQKHQGYDLAKHAGKRCKRYTFVITNYPGQSEDVRLNLLVRDNKVIGGDVCSLLPDGFMHGFSVPETAPETAK